MSQPNEGQDHLDYRETEDVTEVHASVLREHEEPKADSLPIPTWLAVLCTASLCWAGAYIGMFHGGFSSKVYNEYDSNPSAFFPLPSDGQGPGEVQEVPLLVIGQKAFANCTGCHGSDGKGTDVIPPLAGSEWIAGAEHGDKRLIALLLKGVGGQITVKGKTYTGAMPAWESLKDKEIAGLVTYLHQSLNQGKGEVNEAMVKAVRKEFKGRNTPWTEAELKAIPIDAKIEGVEVPAGGDKPAAPAAPGDEPAATAPAAGGTFNLAASVEAGKATYMTTCFACHQATGQGLPGTFPPIAGTDFVNGDPRRLIAIALKGVTGPIVVNGTNYSGVMPPPDAAFPQLKDDKTMADVLNYVRNGFGDKNDVAITPEMVAKTRKEFESRTESWTGEELKNFPAPK